MVEKKLTIKNISLVIVVLILMVLIVFMVGKAFGFFSYAKEGSVVNSITIRGLTVDIDSESDDALNIVNAYPMYDSQGMENEAFIFTVTNNSSHGIDYNLIVENDSDKLAECLQTNETCPELSTDYIRYSYKVDNGTWSSPANLGDNSNIIHVDSIRSNQSTQISIKLWIDEDAGNEIQGHYFFGKLVIEGAKSLCTLEVGDVITFNYTGNEQVFDVPCDGNYKLETWGAQGGSEVGNGGYGGYAVGIINTTKNQSLYVNVGGEADPVLTVTTDSKGGYNGGGDAYHWRNNDCINGGGGGATHIATVSGELKNLSSYKDTGGTNISNEILIVSGGGGGYGGVPNSSSSTNKNIGGHAGGFSGNRGTYGSIDGWGSGGTQTAGGVFTVVFTDRGYGESGSFGKGGNSSKTSDSNGMGGGSAGGAGWYGGAGSSAGASGGGGSSYIASSQLGSSIETKKAMYCYGCTEDLTNDNTFTVSTNGTSSYRDTTNCPNGYSSDPISKCAKADNGYAKITYLGNE